MFSWFIVQLFKLFVHIGFIGDGLFFQSCLPAVLFQMSLVEGADFIQNPSLLHSRPHPSHPIEHELESAADGDPTLQSAHTYITTA